MIITKCSGFLPKSYSHSQPLVAADKYSFNMSVGKYFPSHELVRWKQNKKDVCQDFSY